MPERVPITESSLRAALRDPRYWTSGHPEREAYAAPVTDGFRALYNSGEAKGGTVHVRALTRKRDGKVEHVGAHDRSAPPGGLVTPVVSAHIRPSLGTPSLRDPLIIGGGGGIILAPRPGIPPQAPAGPRRPSLLDPPEEERRPPGTIGGAVQNAPPEQNDQPPGPEPQGPRGEAAPAGPGLRPSPDTVEGLIDRLRPSGQNSKGTPNFDGGGNEDQLDADTRALHPGPMTELGPGRRIGTLPDGRQIMVRPSSERSSGEPTLEISKPVGVNAAGRPRYEREFEIRYRPGRTGP